MKLQDVLGQDVPARLLRRALDSRRLPHAFLFHGPEGVGKRTVATAFAASLLCEENGADACGSCAACRKLAHENHPDFFFVTRQPKPRKGGERDPGTGGAFTTAKVRESDLRSRIVVDQIRELAEHAAYAPSEGRRRIFVIDPADRMNGEAQNALLKTLEEPAARSMLVLVTSSPHLLLPTVRSRCLAIKFACVGPGALTRFLESRGLTPDEAVRRAALSGGSPGRALALDVEALERRREEILGDLEELAASPAAMADLAGMVSRLAGKDEPYLAEGLDLVQGMLRDAARATAGAPEKELRHPDLAPRLLEIGRKLGSRRAASLVEGIDRLRGRLRFNANRTLLAESVLAAVAGGPVP